MIIEYDGTQYHGWQQQPSGVATVQAELQKALSKVANEPITLVCAGRTDAGVHGTYQVIHFDTTAQRKPRQWLLGVSCSLPRNIGVRWAGEVNPQFHARFSAGARTYRYIICNEQARPGLFGSHLTWEGKPLDVDLMQQGGDFLVGEHDFSSFRASGCQAHSPVRTVSYLKLWRQNNLVVMEIKANAFLHHMVRNIIGVLLEVGKGDQPPGWVKEVLEYRNRELGGVTAKPHGLYLVKVDYPDGFGIPELLSGPAFIERPLHTP
ncbi:MAG: tRNA pseudouridine(38-40) synthase TruA [Cellvibrionaceae bacterium]